MVRIPESFVKYFDLLTLHFIYLISVRFIQLSKFAVGHPVADLYVHLRKGNLSSFTGP